MKNFIRSAILTFTVASAILLNGCDIFENFLFNVPISFTFEDSGLNLFDSGSACLEDNETYNDNKDKINSISFVEGYIAVLNVNPDSLRGSIRINIHGGTSEAGPLLIEYELIDVEPSDYSPNSPLKLQLDANDIQNLNGYFADKSNPRCFFASFEVADVQNISLSNSISVRVDLLFLVDADL